MKTPSRLPLVAMSLLWLCCYRTVSPLDKDVIVGKWVANHDAGIDVLRIRSDGTYTQYLKRTDGKDFKNSGTWTIFQASDGHEGLSFSDFTSRLPGSEFGPGWWGTGIARTPTGELRIPINSDVGYYYVKSK